MTAPIRAAVAGYPAPSSKAGCRPLTDEEIAAGRRYTSDGLLCGTPRCGEDDWRFDRSFVPPDVFEPNAHAVWAVLDRLTWFSFADAERLVDVAHRVRRGLDPGDHYNDVYHSAQAARAAGGRRYGDWQDIEEIARLGQEMVRPPQAGLSRNSWSGACDTWSGAFMSLGCRAAQAFLVADRPELSDNAFEWLTGPWRTAFPDTTPARRPAVVTENVDRGPGRPDHGGGR